MKESHQKELTKEDIDYLLDQKWRRVRSSGELNGFWHPPGEPWSLYRGCSALRVARSDERKRRE